MRVLFILAHPDDESYGPAGSILKCTENGADVYLITLTRGEAGTLGDSKVLKPQELADLRSGELKCAAKVLKLYDLLIGDFPDGRLNKTPVKKGVSFLLEKINKIVPDIIVTFHPNGITGHKDHIAISKWTLNAIQKIGYPVKLLYYGISEKLVKNLADRQLIAMPDNEITHEIDVSSYLDKKVEAIHCHKSQLEIFKKMKSSVSDYRLLVGKEYFSQVIPKPSSNKQEFKLF